MMYCLECGNQITAEAAFCVACGAALAESEVILQHQEQRTFPWLWLLILSVAAIICLGGALVAAGWYVYWRPEPQPIVISGGRQPVVEEAPAARMPVERAPAAPDTVAPTLSPAPQPAENITPFAETDVAPTSALSETPTATPSPTPTATPMPTNTPTATPTRDLGPETIVIGRSVRDTPLEATRFGAGDNVIIFVGGLHAGFAPGSVTLADRAIDHFQQNPDEIPPNVSLYILANVNPDSPYNPGELPGRLNANGIDLNRNWNCRWTPDPRWRNVVQRGIGGSAPLSEPETRALADFILAHNPRAVIFWQAMVTNGLASPGNCGARSQSSEDLARLYGLAAGYQIADFEQLTNQVINGDATNWLDSQGIPAISVLLPTHTNADWLNNLAGIRAVLRAYE